MLTLILATALFAQAEEPPNIVFIMSDDHAWQAISAYGSDRNVTPNIDRIATEGITFDRYYVENAICAPSRAAILTGVFSEHHGVPTNSEVFDGTHAMDRDHRYSGGELCPEITFRGLSALSAAMLAAKRETLRAVEILKGSEATDG